MQPTYQYNATITNVHDGDTITVVVDLGFQVAVTVVLRLNGINAPEIFGPEKPQGEASRQHLIDLLGYQATGTPAVVRTYKKHGDKYGRWLADVYNSAGVCVNVAMVQDGYAVPYSG